MDESQNSVKLYSRLRTITPESGYLKVYVDEKDCNRIEKILSDQISVGIQLVQNLNKFRIIAFLRYRKTKLT